MHRNQYDTDVCMWSPNGRLHQVEYAMEAVKQGGACVGVCSKTHAVLASLKRSASELSSYQKKVFEIDDHIGIAISGLTADARHLSKYMRTECLNHKFVYDSAMPISRLANRLGDKHQACTQTYSAKRPFGVGLLVVGCDETGPHLFQTCPTGNIQEYFGMAIGARSQSAKTYLEKHFESFPDMSEGDLVKHALKALDACTNDQDLDAKNCALGVVGIDQPFKIYEDDAVAPLLDAAFADEDEDKKQDAGDAAMPDAA